MKVYLTDQESHFKKHLELFKSKPVMAYDKTKLIEKVSTVPLTIHRPINLLDLSCLFNYRIFPPYIMTAMGEWEAEHRKMEIGDTIVQQIYMPPIKSIAQKIIFGVRINEMIDDPYRKGFSYETLEGHVEKGISTFTVEEIGEQLFFKIQTYSAPGNLLSKLLGPFFSIPYQAYCTRQALDYVRMQLQDQ